MSKFEVGLAVIGLAMVTAIVVLKIKTWKLENTNRFSYENTNCSFRNEDE